MNPRIALLPVLAALLAVAAPAAAGEPTKAEAVKKLKELQPALAQTKTQGSVGEVYTGYVGAVKKADEATRKLIEAVNLNRKVIYKSVAQKHGITTEKAGILIGQRNFKKANPGEYLKDKDGRWRQKK